MQQEVTGRNKERYEEVVLNYINNFLHLDYCDSAGMWF